jgi:hypothetical protein
MDGRQRATLDGQARSGGAMNRARHAAARQQLGVGGVYDRLHVGLPDDVARDTFNARSLGSALLGHWNRDM